MDKECGKGHEAITAQLGWAVDIGPEQRGRETDRACPLHCQG